MYIAQGGFNMTGRDTHPNGIRQVPVGIWDRILEIGNTFDETLIDTMEELYSPLLVERDRSAISVTKDIPYGAHERHMLDVHLADESGEGLTCVLFFHGGGFVRGHKNMGGEIFYGNVANYFARHGMIGVTATYRLAPDHPWPSGADDVGAALDWARDNISDFGGDPDRIVIMGQSAGPHMRRPMRSVRISKAPEVQVVSASS